MLVISSEYCGGIRYRHEGLSASNESLFQNAKSCPSPICLALLTTCSEMAISCAATPTDLYTLTAN